MISEIRKKELRDENIKKDRRQNNKQHCQKILEGINKFDNTTAERAIWELLQNARDLSDHAHARIVLDKDKLTFSHNGKPFDYDTFTSLIKQVSSEEKEDPNSAGQFGTGFMTTHKFSRKIHINGCMKIDEGEYAEIDDFILDRSDNEIQAMIEAMTKQLEYADGLLEKETTPVPCSETSFVYELDSVHFPAAEQGVTAAFDLMPYVMTFNERIEEVTIIDRKNSRQETFTKKGCRPIDIEKQLHAIDIETTASPSRTIFFLQSEDKKSIIILPLKTENEAMDISGIPRLFIFFPLLGTHTFGFNFIFHSERFYPEEPRNSIVLPEDNIDKQNKYRSNVQVINEMLQMLFAYLEKYGESINNSKLIAPINIDLFRFENSHQLTREFYSNLKNVLVNKYLSIPFLRVNDVKVSASQSEIVRFLSSEIVTFLRTDEGAKYLDVVYTYASMVSNLPPKDEVLSWSEIVAQWDDKTASRFITIEDIVNSIIEKSDNTQLHDFLLFLKDSGQSSYFSTKELIPNREGIRKTASDLRDAEDIPSILYNICKQLIPADTNKFVEVDYADICEFTKYGRDDMKKSINEYVNSQKLIDTPFKETLNALLDYCSIFPVQNGSSIRNNSMPHICTFFGHTYREAFVSPLYGVKTDTEQSLYYTAFETLVDYTLKQIQIKGEINQLEGEHSWYDEHKTLHYDILSALCNRDRPSKYQTELFKKYAIIPNQVGKLCNPENLNVLLERERIPQDVQHTLFEIYQKVFKSSYEENLIEEQYAWMFAYEGIDPKKIGSEIEEALKESQYSNPVTIEIIDLLDKDGEQGYWHKWFDNININKPHIFLNRLKGQERTHTYKFMKASPEKKEKVAELVDDPYFEIIIDKAREYLQNERDRQLVFNHMYYIGKAIEDKLRERLQGELLQVEFRKEGESMEVNDIQNGQDIVIRYRGQIIYFVEVKSKWNFDQPAHMSTNQMRQAVLNSNCYALCCVDLTDYSANIAEVIDADTIIRNTFVHLDIGHQLSHFY
ncbi:MAG: hypothetical protein IJK93_05110 [Muribaculaceae bacterium]|nr:hypothetical protein [Muribaculaceae bacterium]